MNEKRLAVLVELDKTGHLRARIETDKLSFLEFEAMSDLAITNIIKGVAEAMDEAECRKLYFDKVAGLINDIREELEGE